ncbi:MAG: type II toxin-antitoxin system VapC family toxin [Gemmatimonadales bacterium]|nr:type II toxin-antitoxin system VapC family toxin [Gemmatimonadales bacterium]
MGVIIDTSVLIAGERGGLGVPDLLRSLGTESVAIAAITASELLHGCHRAKEPATRIRRTAFVDALLALLPSVSFGLAEARVHAAVWAELTACGIPIGAHDLLIAATALARGDAVATLNHREFSRVPGLRLLALEG